MKLNKTLATASILAMLPMASSAAVITWDASVNMFAGGDNSSFISQNGTFVNGFNGGGPDTSGPATPGGTVDTTTVTIGTSVFTAANYADLNGGITAGGVTISTNISRGTGGGTFQDGEFTNSDISTLIGSTLYTGTSVDLSGLTIGNTYELQILLNDARGGTGAGVRDEEWKVGFNDGAGGTTIAGMASLNNRPYGDGADPNLAGDYIIGTFVAGAGGTQSFTFAATRGNNAATETYVLGGALNNINGGQAQINALQLRDLGAVPEPSSTALLGLGGLALLLRRRK